MIFRPIIKTAGMGCLWFTSLVTCVRQDFETATNLFQRQVGPVDLQCPTIDAWATYAGHENGFYPLNFIKNNMSL